MKIIVAHNRHWISLWIRRHTWSEWSHTGIVDGDVVLEAKGIAVWPMLLVLLCFKQNSIELGGVVRTPILEFVGRYDVTRIAYMDGDMALARALVGTPFDPWGMVGILLKKNIHDISALFCAEYVALVATHIRDEFAHTATAQFIFANSRDEPCPADGCPTRSCLLSAA